MAADYAEVMWATGLPMRVVYAAVATPVAAIGGFYLGMMALTHGGPMLQGGPAADPGWAEFVLSLVIGAAVGFTAFLYALTLPWRRLRRRRGRPLRIGLAAVVVLLASVIAAAEAVPLGYVVGLMVWMSLVLTFTWVRYGVLDPVRR